MKAHKVTEKVQTALDTISRNPGDCLQKKQNQKKLNGTEQFHVACRTGDRKHSSFNMLEAYGEGSIPHHMKLINNNDG
jgi:hypothetical protein